MTVKVQTGVGSASTARVSVAAVKGEIHIEGAPDGMPAEVVTVSGMTVYSGCDRVVRGLTPGIYFVVLDGITYKVVI